MDKIADLDRAIQIAVDAHAGQCDRYGETYILHPFRVMRQLQNTPERIVAILHDVVEDSDWTLTDLRNEGFSKEVVDAVDHLTRRHSENYESYIERLQHHTLARKVKIADLEDNMDLTRAHTLLQDDFARYSRYHNAWLQLTKLQR